MIFSTPLFLFLFLPTVLFIYFCSPYRAKNAILLVASLFFYAWGELFYILIMLFSITANYLVAMGIEDAQIPGNRKLIAGFGICINLGLLGLFKYGNFFVANFNHLVGFIGLPPLPPPSFHLPLGISFFTFQALSYVIDVYRKEVRASHNLLDVALYISMFPQLIAGPIVRYKLLADKIKQRRHSIAGASAGVKLFILGLSKKMLIANAVGGVADTIFSLPSADLSFSISWIGAGCYALQIYYDFSGYSDMAIGLGKIFGFDFPENFNFPYFSRSLQEFWRRWHITLSTWFRDYLYIPLGGSRVSRFRIYMNLFIVFFLCGLWHGASWNFVVWGMIHGIFLVIERSGFAVVLQKLWYPLQRIYTLTVVLIAWVFFRSETIGDAMTYINAMLGLNSPVYNYSISYFVHNESLLAICMGVFFCMPVYQYFNQKTATLPLFSHIMVHLHSLAFCVLLFLSMLKVTSATYNPFIYFRF